MTSTVLPPSTGTRSADAESGVVTGSGAKISEAPAGGVAPAGGATALDCATPVSEAGWVVPGNGAADGPPAGGASPVAKFTVGLHRALDRLGPVPAWAMSPGKQAKVLLELTQAEARLAELKLRVLAAADTNQVGGRTPTPVRRRGWPTLPAWSGRRRTLRSAWRSCSTTTT